MTEGTKYHPLFEYLLYSGQGQISMTFKEIESVLGSSLPPSAREREEWWSNSPRGHSQARSWLRAGYRTSGVNLSAETVAFRIEGFENYRSVKWRPRASDAATGLGEAGQSRYLPPSEAGKEHPLFGIWEGKVTLIAGVDYTKPAFDLDDVQ